MNAKTARTPTIVRLFAASLAASAGATIGTLSHAAAEEGTGAEQSGGKEAVVPLVQPSIVYLTTTYTGYVWDPYVGDTGSYLEDGRGDPKLFSVTTQCSGFAVSSNGYLATAGHCVDRKDGRYLVAESAAEWANQTNYYSDYVPVEDLVDDYEVNQYDASHDKILEDTVYRAVKVSWSQSVAGTTVEKQAPARVIAAKGFAQGDAALLKVEADGLNALPLSDGEPPEINSDVITVGYPGIIEGYTDHDLVPTFNPTTVSSHKSINGGLFTILQLSTTLAHGMSGGPTVNLDGAVVGINSSVYEGEEISNAVPVERILELMAGAGVDNEVSETTQAYREGIMAVLAGDKATAITNLTQVVEEQPGNELAADYLARANDLPDPVAPDKPAAAEPGSIPGTLIAGVAGAALIMFGVIGLLVVSHRRNRKSATAHLTPQVSFPRPSQTYPPTTPAQQAAPQAPAAQPVGATGTWATPNPAVPIGFGATAAPDPATPAPATPAGYTPTTHQTGCTNCGNPTVHDHFCGRCGALHH